LRKALFALMLLAASFAGGAVINGPGAKWAKPLLQQYLGRLSGGDDSTATEDLAKVEEGPSAGAGSIPSTPIPPLGGDPDASSDKEKDKSSASGEPARLKTGAVPEPKAPEPLEPLEPKAIGTDASPATDKSTLPASATTLDPLPPLSAPEPLPTSPDKGEPAKAQPYGDAPGSPPATAVPPRPFQGALSKDRDPAVARAGGTAAAEAASSSGSGDWAAIQQKMKALGVTRYGIDGELGGRVRFHCVIPLAGRRAVGQQFEAEGDDAIEAARAALRRVALWRATEEPSP
jgi:hypothetical protein